MNTKDYLSALEYFNKALKIYTYLGDDYTSKVSQT